MTNCKKCGTEISDYQYNNFNGMCSECIRLEPIRRAADAQRKSDKAEWISYCICFSIMAIIGISIYIYMTFFAYA